MLLFLKTVIFKLMEMSLGLRPLLPLATRNPVFVNFRLDAVERARVESALPAGFELRPLRFMDGDAEPAFWVSYNLYAIGYPRPELAGVKKARCEINTFVRGPDGREGVFVFCGSPYVSREMEGSFFGKLCDAAEKLVVLLYGCGRLTTLRYEVAADRLAIALAEDRNEVALDLPLAAEAPAEARLSDDYAGFNDVSFFNGGRTFDLVHIDSAFGRARFQAVDAGALATARIAGPFFDRSPDAVYLHRGEISYLVSALHRVPRSA